MKKFNNILLLLALLVSLFSGCGKKLPDGWPKVYPCTIKVTKSGTPLEDAMVILTSAAGSGGNWAVGATTDAQGVAVIHTSYTNFTEPGAPEGTFKVTIDKSLPPLKDPTPPEELEKLDYIARQAHVAKLDAEAAKRPPIVPKKYSDVSQTPLKVEIKPDSPVEETFEIEK
ncbi:MAG: hypothetical protein LBT05_04420 [Planctomycetaceae bacterium]|jgi:hypothetical protein|nr:hypothetical protein [Planctomycetaceae bacterium]